MFRGSSRGEETPSILAPLPGARYLTQVLIAGADPRVRSAFRATLPASRATPFFPAVPPGTLPEDAYSATSAAAPEVLCIADLAAAIARAEGILHDVRHVRRVRLQRTGVAVEVGPYDAAAATGPSGTQRIAALTTDEAERILPTDAILVLDEYAFKYPAGRLDDVLLADEPLPRRPRTVARHALIGWIAIALLLPVVLTAVFVVGIGVGRTHLDVAAARGNVVHGSGPETRAAPSTMTVKTLPEAEAWMRHDRGDNGDRVRPAPAPAPRPRSRR